MRKAQMFVNSVNYDNTAFIIGLASLLSGKQLSAIDKLRKINPKLFDEKPERKDEEW